MWLPMFAALMAAGTSDSDIVLSQVSADCKTGTLIFSQGDCLAVKIFSHSRLTHCGAVVVEDGQPMVYDAMNGTGVRKSALVDYLRLQTPSEIQFLHPQSDFTAEEAEAFGQHLRGELGRPYGIRHHVSGKKAKGVHCAEYCTEALMAAGKLDTAQPPRVSPGSLHEALLTHGLYADGGEFVLTRKRTEATAENESWCRWAWRETGECTTDCCQQLSRWFLCCEK